MWDVEFLGHGWAAYVLLSAVGACAGAVNVVAGGGSFLTLPVMIFLGLPPTVANGTNRIAILVQNAGAVWAFHRHRLVEGRWMRVAAAPALLGAGLGTWGAVEIGEEAFRRALAALMVVISLWALWSARRPGPTETGSVGRGGRTARGVALGAGFFAVGLYGGFVQAGAGFLILAVTSAGGLDLVRGNALKVLVVLCYTPLALGIFSLTGKVDWAAGAALAAGNLGGGLLGVRLTVLKGHAWVRRVVTAAILVFAIKLWVSP